MADTVHVDDLELRLAQSALFAFLEHPRLRASLEAAMARVRVDPEAAAAVVDRISEIAYRQAEVLAFEAGRRDPAAVDSFVAAVFCHERLGALRQEDRPRRRPELRVVPGGMSHPSSASVSVDPRPAPKLVECLPSPVGALQRG